MQGDGLTGTGSDAYVGNAGAVVDLGGESNRAVYRELLRFGPCSRSELSQRLGLSAPTVTRVSRDLLERGLLHPLDFVQQPRGRPHEPLDVEEDRGPRFIGVKVTSEEVHAVVASVRGNVLEKLVLSLQDTTPESVQAAILIAVEEMIATNPQVAGVGVGLGGLVAKRRTVVSSHLLGWREPIELAADLEAQVARPVVVENDLIAMVNGLHWFGMGRSYDSFTVLTVGAGVGIATVIDGRIVGGSRHMAGLTGHLPVGTGQSDELVPIRELASTQAVLRQAHHQGVISAGDGIEELRALLTLGHEGAVSVATDMARTLATAAVGLVAVVDPEAIMLGGENVDLLSAVEPVFEETLREGITGGQQDIVVRMLSGTFDEWARGVAVIAVQQLVGVEP